MLSSFFKRSFCDAKKYFKDTNLMNMSMRSKDKRGVLETISKCFSDFDINLTYVRSNLENTLSSGSRDFVLNVSMEAQDQIKIQKLTEALSKHKIIAKIEDPVKTIWFPRTSKELDMIGKTLLELPDEGQNNNAQFADPEYRKRRDQIAKAAYNWNSTQPIPDVQYTKEEEEMWCELYRRLVPFHEKGMCELYNHLRIKLDQECGISRKIPQLKDLDKYLRKTSNIKIKPTHGILSQREFLNSLAFRTFCCTQYIRHPSAINYTPEPDIVHEILGHVVMFADKNLADISQKIGLLSLGASDEDVAKLGTLYWFTLEFGVLKENGKIKGHGAGIGGSLEEIENLLSGKPEIYKFNPKIDCSRKFPIQNVQPFYMYTEDLKECLQLLEEYGTQVLKEATTSYNFKTESIDYDRCIEGIYQAETGPMF